jgi:hypothetical protein
MCPHGPLGGVRILSAQSIEDRLVLDQSVMDRFDEASAEGKHENIDRVGCFAERRTRRDLKYARVKEVVLP